MVLRLLKIFLLLIAVAAIAAILRQPNPAHLMPSNGEGLPVIDLHVHVAGLGYGDSGCFINKTMRDNYRFPFYLWSMGVTEEALQQHGDRILFDRLSHDIAISQSVDMAVILAMDGYVTSDGKLDKDKTQIYVPNDYVARETSRFENLLYGASVNPNRKDAIERLHQVKRAGAMLIKWIPSIMNIDPADSRHTAFYRTMAELKIPLLTHTGMEKSFAGAKDELADPQRLKLALEQGVTVIAAHIATTGETDGQDNFERILPMFARYPNLYADISSLTQINKLGFLVRALEVEGLNERMMYGSDWPLQFFPLISPWYHINHISFADAWRIGGIKNQWDRDVALKMAFDVPDAAFYRNARVLNFPEPKP